MTVPSPTRPAAQALRRRFSRRLAAVAFLVPLPPTDPARQTEVPQPALRFEENLGQTDERVRFLARGPGHTLFLAPDEAVLRLVQRERRPDGSGGESRAAVVRLKLDGVEAAYLEGLDPQPGAANYYVGPDPARWRTGVPVFGSVRYAEVRPGVDLVFHGRQKSLEFDWIVAPGAVAAGLGFSIEGGEEPCVEDDGALSIATDCGAVVLHAPLAWQELAGECSPIDARYRLTGRRVELELGPRDPRATVVVDPMVTYLDGAALNGSGDDAIWDIAINPQTPNFPERVYVTGYTDSVDFPVANAIFPTPAGGTDVFVARLDKTLCTVLYATYLGGSGDDHGLAITSDGPAYVTGGTDSPDFPVWDPFGAIGAGLVYGGGTSDAFVIKFEPAGLVIEYSRFLGGSASEAGLGIAVFSQEPYVAGATTSADFPLQDPLLCAGCPAGCAAPFDGSVYAGGSSDAFVTKIGVQGEIDFSTYLGGAAADEAIGVARLAGDPSFVQVFVTGWTASPDFPATCAAYDPTYSGGLTDAFLLRLDLTTPVGGPTTAALGYGTFLGGSGGDGHPPSGWLAADVAVDAAGAAYAAFPTDSTDAPLVSPIQPAYGGGQADAYVAKLDAAGASLVYATYLGGSDEDDPIAIAVDAAGSAHVAGFTRSGDFPTWNTPPGGDVFAGGGTDAFAAKLDAAGAALVFSTFLGTSDEDFARGVAADLGGNTVVGGYALPDPGPGPARTFLVRIADVNTPVGIDVCVQPYDPVTASAPVTLVFSEVTVEGDTILVVGPGGPPPPAGFALCATAPYYDVVTSATYIGPISICIDYSGTCDGPEEANLKLLHFESDAWVDVTTSLDTANDVICGLVTSLSPFAVLQDTRVTLFCFGDGSGAPCPCGNSGDPFHGCANSQVPAGVQLLAASFVPNGAGGGTAVLSGTGFPPNGTPAAVAIRSLNAAAAAPFGDGLLCLAPQVVRIKAGAASGGSIAIAITHGAGAGVFHYQLWYRNQASFCTIDKFNLSNGMTIDWP